MLWALVASTMVSIIAGFAAGIPLLGVACALLIGGVIFQFRSLTVELRDGVLSLRYGNGLIAKRFTVSEIREARAVRNHWYFGWGIRLIPHGWLYNVYGLDAVEIRMANRKVYRIGTDEPHDLLTAILSAASMLT